MEISKMESMRDCVKKAYLEGCSGNLKDAEFQKFRFAIIAEFTRLGCEASEIKDIILEWNSRCEKPLGPSEQHMQLIKYVDWCEKKEIKIGCKALEDYCIGQDKCQHYILANSMRRRESSVLPFNMEELERYLNIRFKTGGKGRTLATIIKVLRKYQLDNNIGQLIYIGYRKISSLLRDEYRFHTNAMEVCRDIKLLIDEGVIEIAVPGKSGDFRMKANGYRFLPWESPRNDP